MSQILWSSSPLRRRLAIPTGLEKNTQRVSPGRRATLPLSPTRIYAEAMSFSDTVFLCFLALILFGPKKLPEMARQAGRLLAELRRASNEFRSQIETEIAHLEVEKSQARAPPTPPPQG